MRGSVAPGSCAVRELLLAISDALTLSAPEAESNELAYLRTHRGRARVVLFAVRGLLTDREISDEAVMAAAGNLRDRAADYPEPSS